MEPIWLVLLVFMLLEALLVLLLAAPMPNNAARGAVLTFISSLWDKSGVRYVFYALLTIDVFYFWYVLHTMSALAEQPTAITTSPPSNCIVQLSL